MVRVLIVDDNATFRSQARRLCEAEGFEAVAVGTLEELHLALEGPAPDIVLMDVDLPTIPGHRLGSLVRSRHQVPICLVSAFPEDKLRKMFEQSDANGWIPKPLTRDKLIGVVTRLVGRDKLTDRAVKVVAAAPALETAATDGGRPKILVVEDDPLLSDRIELVLQSLGSVKTVVDGEGAISELFTGFFDAIVLDLMLPRLSGFDVIRHLMMRRPDLLKSTIIVTGAQDSTLQFIDANELYAVLHKPFDFNELPRLVSELIGPKG
ncbi:MAG: response regulator [Acidobacteria bacterium]|nr:response regulator [Acidobacteriota bacterium]